MAVHNKFFLFIIIILYVIKLVAIHPYWHYSRSLITLFTIMIVREMHRNHSLYPVYDFTCSIMVVLIHSAIDLQQQYLRESCEGTYINTI